ncbi:MAG: CAP domain-containing protein [Persicimonas sp.]
MKHIIAITALFALCACQTGGTTYSSSDGDGGIEKTRTSGDPLATCDSPQKAEVVEFANEARDEEGLGDLYCDRELASIAQRHAEDMCENDYLSHTSQDGRTMRDRADRAGINYQTLGENVAMGQTAAHQVHDNWMESPNHRKNIMRDSFSRIGVGHAPCDGRPYWVQVFAN